MYAKLERYHLNELPERKPVALTVQHNNRNGVFWVEVTENLDGTPCWQSNGVFARTAFVKNARIVLPGILRAADNNEDLWLVIAELAPTVNMPEIDTGHLLGCAVVVSGGKKAAEAMDRLLNSALTGYDPNSFQIIPCKVWVFETHFYLAAKAKELVADTTV